jgi:hypothetical protein
MAILIKKGIFIIFNLKKSTIIAFLMVFSGWKVYLGRGSLEFGKVNNLIVGKFIHCEKHYLCLLNFIK